MKKLSILLLIILSLFSISSAFASIPQNIETTLIVTVVPVFELAFKTSDLGIDILARSSSGKQWFIKAESLSTSYLDYISKKDEWNNMPNGSDKQIKVDIAKSDYIIISMTE